MTALALTLLAAPVPAGAQESSGPNSAVGTLEAGPALSADQEARARRIGSGLRCPVCQGLPISESPAALARQMMAEVRDRIARGENDEQVRSYFVSRYGEAALLAPPPSGLGLLLWAVPVAALLLGGLGLTRYLRAASRPVSDTEVSPELLERVERELQQRHKENAS
nr:cytochrome c-type biogenesis protein CcmH [Deinobacterium chartae]